MINQVKGKGKEDYFLSFLPGVVGFLSLVLESLLSLDVGELGSSCLSE